MEILWVENHAEFAGFAGRRFLAGHAVTVVPSLAAAREALAGAGFDVVLVDYDLDDGQGVDLIRELRRAPRCPRLVAVSARDDGNRALIEAGADAACDKRRFGRIVEILAGSS